MVIARVRVFWNGTIVSVAWSEAITITHVVLQLPDRIRSLVNFIAEYNNLFIQ